jgi:hypothetical protein
VATLTIEAAEAFGHAGMIWLPGDLTDILPELRTHLPDATFAELTCENPPTQSVEFLLAQAAAGERPYLGVLGSGLEPETLLRAIQCGARSAGITVQIVAGRSLPDIVLECVQGAPTVEHAFGPKR